MRLINRHDLVFTLTMAFLLVLGCVTEKEALRAESSLPPDRLAYYQDLSLIHI